MNKTNAIKHARSVVSDLSPFGDGYKYTRFDEGCNAWRESQPMPYYQALSARSQALIDEARAAMGYEPGFVQYEGGKWVDYV